MCRRFAVTQPRFTHIEKVLSTQFNDVQPHYNFAPSEHIAVIYPIHDQFVMSNMRWGLVPSWSKTLTTTNSTFNADIETVTENRLYRSAFRHRRCLIPASGFYGWHTEGDNIQPYYFTRIDGEEMAFAGLWEEWMEVESTILQSSTILMGAPNYLVGKLHDRMACIVPENHYRDWLDPKMDTENLLAMLSVPYPEEKMKMVKVSTKVNSIWAEGSELIQPI